MFIYLIFGMNDVVDRLVYTAKKYDQFNVQINYARIIGKYHFPRFIYCILTL